MYWAGPRCFLSTMRHYDFNTIKFLEEKYSWNVYDPIQLVSEAQKRSKDEPLLGPNGIIRKTCLKYVKESDLIVAYYGPIWDSGTAIEVEYAAQLRKPILAWSDSSVIVGETFEKNKVVDGKEIDQLYIRALPFNAMEVVFDKFIRLADLSTRLAEKDLAEILNKEAIKLLNEKNSNA